MKLLDVLTELADATATVMGEAWSGHPRVHSQRVAWHSPAVLVDRVQVQYEYTLSQALVTVTLLFLADESATDSETGIDRLYDVASAGDDGLAAELAAVVSPNGLWTDIASEGASIENRLIGQNMHLAAVMPVQLMCPINPGA